MINEKGITLTSLVISVVLLTVLAALTINVSLYNNVIEERNDVQEHYNGLMENVESNVKSIQEQWNGVI